MPILCTISIMNYKYYFIRYQIKYAKISLQTRENL